VKLYFAEQETKRLHVIDLAKQESEIPHDISSDGDHDLKIDRLVPAISNSGSFTGIQIESSTVDSSNNILHSYFSSTAQRFSQYAVSTETTAFDSYNLTYLVSFAANLRTLIILEDGTTR